MYSCAESIETLNFLREALQMLGRRDLADGE